MSTNLIIIAVVAYLIGSIPFGYILVKIFLKQDIRQTGSGNIGATNVARSGNKGLAIATLLLDAGKGALAAYLVFALAESQQTLSGGAVLAPLMATVGHCFPIWLRFKGGKGVATAVGALAVFWSSGVLVAIGCFVTVFAITRYVSLASIISAVAFPLAAYYFEDLLPFWMMATLSATSLLIILKHHGNIRRLIAGTEPRFGKQAIGTNDPGETEKSI